MSLFGTYSYKKKKKGNRPLNTFGVIAWRRGSRTALSVLSVPQTTCRHLPYWFYVLPILSVRMNFILSLWIRKMGTSHPVAHPPVSCFWVPLCPGGLELGSVQKPATLPSHQILGDSKSASLTVCPPTPSTLPAPRGCGAFL